MPSSGPRRSDRSHAWRPRWAVLAIAVAGLAWLAGAGVAPALEAAGEHSAAAWLRAPYAPLCHQIEGRCLAIDGRPMALCSRCSGLYAGGIAGLFAGAAFTAWRRRWPAWAFFAALAPTVLQWTSARLGAPEPGALVRFALALPAGFVCGWFLAHAVGDLAEGAAAPPVDAVAGAGRGPAAS